jgi:triacylglycerol lipase
VTFGRAIIKGGVITACSNPYGLGPSLSSYVDTFVAIAGANYGIQPFCQFSSFVFCNSLNGFYPGWGEGFDGPIFLSQYLQDLNDNPIREADYVFAIYSPEDNIVGNEVFGQ